MVIYIPSNSNFYFHIDGDRLHKTHYKLMENISRAKYVWTHQDHEDLEKELLNKIIIANSDGWKVLHGEI